jgi:aflatoxin B1 aldehyde reductase
MDLSQFQDAKSVSEVFDALKNLGIDCIDTAARYPPLNWGGSEKLIGEALAAGDYNFRVDTKAFTDTATDGSGDLTREKLH